MLLGPSAPSVLRKALEAKTLRLDGLGFPTLWDDLPMTSCIRIPGFSWSRIAFGSRPGHERANFDPGHCLLEPQLIDLGLQPSFSGHLNI